MEGKTFKSYSGTIVREYKSSVARDAKVGEIPVISFSQPETELLDQLEYAVTKVGFFYLKDSGVKPETKENLMNAAKEFFGLSESIKTKYDIRTTKHLRGYEGFNMNHIELDLKPDINEQFNWGYDPRLDPDNSNEELSWNTENPMFGENRWPQECKNLELAASAYMGEILTLARKLASFFAKILGLEPDFFQNCLKQPGCMGRVIHYPSQSPSDNALGIGAHTDIECFTILMTDMVPALQILNSKGEWIKAPPVPDAFVINIGDLLARWSNDRFLSTIHRVLNITGNERFSVPVFIGPSYDTVIKPLETCITEGTISPYKPIVAGEYVHARLKHGRRLED